MTKTNKLIFIGALGGILAYLFFRGKNANASVSGSYNPIGYIAAGLGDIMGVQAMRAVNKNLINNPQIKAFLKVIRYGEGTADVMGYSRLFGGNSFSSFADHPNITVSKSGYKSTAAGAYQFLKSTWDETAQAMGLFDFSPMSQDLGALGRLAYRGAIDDIMNGNLESAFKKASKEWASLPYSPYGQPTISEFVASNVFIQNGGKMV